MLKLARPEVKIIATEPAGASLLGGKAWAPHKIQGWTPDFLPDVLNRRCSISCCLSRTRKARIWRAGLAAEEGIFCGISAGATVAAAMKAAENASPARVARDASRHRRALLRRLPVRGPERGLRTTNGSRASTRSSAPASAAPRAALYSKRSDALAA